MNTPGSILNLNTFSAEVEKMRIAQREYFERMAQAKKSQNPKAFDEARKILSISKQLESNVDKWIETIRVTNRSLTEAAEAADPSAMVVVQPVVNQPRLAFDQVEADNEFLVKLEDSVERWKAELENIEKELIDQALLDAKEGARSSRYLALEKREKYLKDSIAEANIKLGRVTERVANPIFAHLNGQ